VNDKPSDVDGEKPRRSFWATVPPRTATRIVILLALLAGVIVLQHRAGTIASCANQAFNLPPSSATATSTGGGGILAPGHIRAHVVLPDTSPR
jgi:hypothetical protein